MMDNRLEQAIAMLESARSKANANRVKRNLEKKLQPKIAKAFDTQKRQFLKAFSGLQSKFGESITPKDWQTLWTVVAADTEELFTVPIQEAVETALYRGALSQISTFGMDIAFGLDNPLAVAFLEDYAATQVKGINDTTRDQLKTVITNAMKGDVSYTDLAKQISQTFDGFSGKARGPRHLRSRAELVSVTEVGNAYAEGNQIVIKGLQADGLSMLKRWMTRGDDRVSAGCEHNAQAGWIAFDKAYPSGDMRPLRFPGCRCEEEYKIDPKGGA